MKHAALSVARLEHTVSSRVWRRSLATLRLRAHELGPARARACADTEHVRSATVHSVMEMPRLIDAPGGVTNW